jgi:hypothetical protein
MRKDGEPFAGKALDFPGPVAAITADATGICWEESDGTVHFVEADEIVLTDMPERCCGTCFKTTDATDNDGRCVFIAHSGCSAAGAAKPHWGRACESWCQRGDTPEQPTVDPYTGSDLEREREIAEKMDWVDYKWRSEKIQRLRKKFQRRNEPLPSLSDFNPNKWAGRRPRVCSAVDARLRL